MLGQNRPGDNEPAGPEQRKKKPGNKQAPKEVPVTESMINRADDTV